MKIVVTPGIIDLNHVVVLKNEKHIVWISIDTIQKYPLDGGGASHENEYGLVNEMSIFLSADKRTLNVVDKKLYDTEITVSELDPSEAWTSFVQMHKYGAEVIFIKRPQANDEWGADDWFSEKEKNG